MDALRASTGEPPPSQPPPRCRAAVPPTPPSALKRVPAAGGGGGGQRGGIPRPAPPQGFPLPFSHPPLPSPPNLHPAANWRGGVKGGGEEGGGESLPPWQPALLCGGRGGGTRGGENTVMWPRDPRSARSRARLAPGIPPPTPSPSSRTSPAPGIPLQPPPPSPGIPPPPTPPRIAPTRCAMLCTTSSSPHCARPPQPS